MRFAAAILLFAGSVMAGEGGDYTTVTQTSTTLACPSSVTDCPLRNSPSTWAASNPATFSTAGWVSPTHSVNVAAVNTAGPSHPSTFSTAWSGNSTSTGGVYVNGGSGSGAYGNGVSGSGGSGSVSSGSGASGNGRYGTGVSGNGTLSTSGNGTLSTSGIVTAGASAVAPASLAIVAGLIAFLA